LLNLDISSEQLVPVIWDQRLYLIWPNFKQIAVQPQPNDLEVPASGGSVAAPRKFWSIEFAMSERSAGQWQAKRTITEKIYFMPDSGNYVAPDFNFKVTQDPSVGLQIESYILGNTMVFQANLQTPDSPLAAVVLTGYLPLAEYVDIDQDPTYSLLTTQSLSGSLTAPVNYVYWGQDLVPVSFFSVTPPIPLIALCATTNSGPPVNVLLLEVITNPRIIIPQQQATFDSTDPFFVEDRLRTYFVQPYYYVSATDYQQLPTLTGATQWYTRYLFETYYHPFAPTFLRELETGGIPGLMSRSLQLTPQTVRGWDIPFSFSALYMPGPQVRTHYPGDNLPGNPDAGENGLDFAAGSAGAYSLYNWELFYHVPMFVASLLMQNQQYQDAMTWLEYIFNPTDSSSGTAPQRFWQMAPFNLMYQTDWVNQEIQNLLNTLAADQQLNNSNAVLENAITAWMLDPFDPHLVAGLRLSAYAKATVMLFLDNLVAWGDSLYSQYTAETVNQAEQLYILADLILGPRPDTVRLPNSNESGIGTATYASLKNSGNLDAFSNVLVNIENVIVAPEPPQALTGGTLTTPSLPTLPGNADTLLFCIPPNAQLLTYWDTVAQRLDNIRNCRNLQGIVQPLPLYAPPINPLLLVEAQANGGGISRLAPTAPIYRFATYLQKAIELANEVRAYGSLLLSSLEKQDAETLTALHANQELDIQTRMLDVKTAQVTEAHDQITALNKQKDVVTVRYTFYHTVAYTNSWEDAAAALQASALILNAVGGVLDLTAAGTSLIPTVNFGVSGFGGTPLVNASFGGENVANSSWHFATAAKTAGSILSEGGNLAATWGSYRRRKDEWTLQENIAIAENLQLDAQIAAANDRLSIATKELDIQNQQISNAQTISTFLTNKYTNAQLYNWMATQLSTVYTQAYQLAFSLALQAQNAYQYELGRYSDSFIQPGYWDSQHQGLTAAEGLIFDLRRMETQYLAQNTREFEITRHISLVLASPLQLVVLRETGQCTISLDESLFDSDYPGHYFRRLRAVALTVPCVTGPYTGVNATLSQGPAIVRVQAPASGYQPWDFTTPPTNQPVVASPVAALGTSTIVTSSGQNDAGLFEVNLRDERWLPFEGQGAVSTWNLTLDPRDNNFDFSTITDVVLHLRYTARGGGDANAVRAAIKSQIETSRSIAISTRSTFGNAYYTFFNPPVAAATAQTLTLPLTNILFPYSNLGNGVQISSFAFHVPLSVSAAGNMIAAAFGVTGVASPAALSLAPSSLTLGDGTPVAALTGAAPLTPPLSAPQSFDLTVPSASVPAALATTVGGVTRLDPSKIEDIFLIVNYSID
jgi:Tc toxin complex TcA C-terminal TcB-binding domain/Neuraminidase-like domain